jgi:hypothetical protein
MNKHGFNLTQLLHELVTSDRPIRRWQDLEQLVVEKCKRQDPRAIHNTDRDPDVLLSNGVGVEAKSTSSLTRGIHLNSAAPDPGTFYVIAHYTGGRIRNVAIVSGHNFYCPEIADIKKTNTSLRQLSNKNLRYRTRIMWEIRSPFEIWGTGNFIVDKLGVVKRY